MAHGSPNPVVATLALLGLACSSEPDTPPKDATVVPQASDPSASTPSQTPGETPSEPPVLSLVARRHGPMRSSLTPFSASVLVEREVWPLSEAGLAPAPLAIDASQVSGEWWELSPSHYIEGQDGAAFLVMSLVHPRAGWHDTRVYARADARWTPMEFGAQEPLVSTVIPSFVREGAVMGVWRHRLEPAAANEGLTLAGLDVTLEHGFGRLAGASEATIPRVPAALEVRRAVATPEGTVYALAQSPPRSERDERRDGFELLVWPTGEVEAVHAQVPGLDAVEWPTLSVAATELLVHGRDRYLARGHDQTWEQVELALPEREGLGQHIVHATATSTGALWIAVASERRADPVVFVRPADSQSWVEVPIPAYDPDIVPQRWWSYAPGQGGWFEVEPLSPDSDSAYVYVHELAWAAGRVWIEVEIGPVSDRSGELLWDSLELLFTVGELDQDAVEIPSHGDAVFGARAQKSARGDCSDASIVIGSPGDPPALDEAQLETLEALAFDEPEREPYYRHLYIGERGGQRALIFQARFNEDRDARRYAKRMAKQLGVSATLDCRPWRPLELVSRLRER